MKNKIRDKNQKIQIILIILISLLVGYFFGVNKIKYDWQNYKPQLSIINQEPPPGLITVDATPFWTVWAKLEQGYYDKSKLNTQKMLNGAIEGMVQSLGDPFTLYLPPAQNSSFQQGLAGQFSGIGAELGLGPDAKQIIIIAPLTGSPSEKAGIKAGDVILGVDGQSTTGWDLNTAVAKIRGPKGTKVTLTVLHKGSKTPVDIVITRDVITVKSVTGWVKPVSCSSGTCQTIDQSKATANNPEVAYIDLSQFGDNTNQDWTSVVNSLVTQMKGKNVKGIILDLRNNPGGYLTDATYIASEFLAEGSPVVTEDDGIPADQKTLYATRQGAFTNIPVVVLINKGSASASEIVAGALRDNGRAKLVGDTSFGKGTIQEAEDLGGGAGLHVTIAKWLTPKGTWVNGKGLTPDYTVNLNPNDPSTDTQLEKAIQVLVQ
ncbi:MAG: S41 family peptidase [Patescibacteria group bacterium]|nr:S41 family peptidase [Patescibacteria group bacterium]